MDLPFLTSPGAVGDLHYELGAATGLDRVAQVVLSKAAFRRFVAGRLIKHFGPPPGRRLTFRVPGDQGVWEAVPGAHGHYVVPWHPWRTKTPPTLPEERESG